VSVLADHQIEWYCQEHRMIDPYRPEHLQPASIDLTLSRDFRVFKDNSSLIAIDLHDPSTYEDLTTPVHVKDQFVIHPGEFVLGATDEVVKIPDDLVSRIEGKSSLGRLGLVVHATAGYIDPGFHGKVTLEMANWMKVPIIVYPGDPFCQLAFTEMSARPRKSYQGRYQGDMNAAPSRYGEAWKQGETRICPDNGNAMVWQGEIGLNVIMADIFGGHEATVPKTEWESWELIERSKV
jgi:dCTP deaminase